MITQELHKTSSQVTFSSCPLDINNKQFDQMIAGGQETRRLDLQNRPVEAQASQRGFSAVLGLS